jgi:hypothetical protein
MTTPQSPDDIAAIEAMAGAELPAAYRNYLAQVGAVEFDPAREVQYEYPDGGLTQVSWVAVTEMLGRDGVEKAMTAWWSPASGQYLPPGFLVIGIDGAFSPLLLGFGAQDGVWYLPTPVERPWQPDDMALLHLIRPDFATFNQALG